MVHDAHATFDHVSHEPLPEVGSDVAGFDPLGRFDGGALGGPIPTVGAAFIEPAGEQRLSPSELAYGAPSTPASSSALRFGASGSEVAELQARLNTRGASLVVDGIFGAKTHAAVIEFQRANDLSPDGAVGPLTWSALDAAPDEQPAERVLQKLDRNGDVASGEIATSGNLVAAPKSGDAGGRHGIAPDEFTAAIDSKQPRAESAAELGQRLWWTSIARAIYDDVAAIAAEAETANAPLAPGVVKQVLAILDALGAKDVAEVTALAGALLKALPAAGARGAKLAKLAALGSPNKATGKKIFHALWRGYDTNPESRAVPEQYRDVGSALSVQMYEVHACAEVAGIAARRYYADHEPHRKTSFTGGGNLVTGGIRNTERVGNPPRMLGDVVQYGDLGAQRAGLLDALDAGYVVLAHVQSGSCVHGEDEVWGSGKPVVKGASVQPKGEHWLLIIGFDGNAFDYWNPSGAGGAFGKLYLRDGSFSTAKDAEDLHVTRGGGHATYGRHRYQVVSLAVQPAPKATKSAAMGHVVEDHAVITHEPTDDEHEVPV